MKLLTEGVLVYPAPATVTGGFQAGESPSTGTLKEVPRSRAARHPEPTSGQVLLGSEIVVTVLRGRAILDGRLPWCDHNVINHFFCEILAMLKLACGDISLPALSLMLTTALLSLTPLLLISLSYVFILAAILRAPSAAGRRKAFSTCSTHLFVVVIFYGTISFMYFRPKAKDPDSDKLIALFYGLATPSLNPVIYSLRNAEVKAAAGALLRGELLARKMPLFQGCTASLWARRG
ncbi:olfactory receptor 13C7-like [Echinops telfairi]|uniref:Olfactory receptor 13C7-like n=1 Tax=Echinops telfairi TaxID=9371 RepID=A0ABM0J125_ECHTE|nr:olfactory receptor 13C7-like [Echinops telfairi]